MIVSKTLCLWERRKLFFFCFVFCFLFWIVSCFALRFYFHPLSSFCVFLLIIISASHFFIFSNKFCCFSPLKPSFVSDPRLITHIYLQTCTVQYEYPPYSSSFILLTTKKGKSIPIPLSSPVSISSSY
jgi:hypothetical protein